jgi:predicted membrane-bound mannosyltransferase
VKSVRAERTRCRYALAVLLVLTIGVAVRLLPLYWTPYPFNPDGFVFAAAARDSLAAGAIPGPNDHPAMDLHRYVFVSLLVILGLLTGLEPIWLAQPIIAIVGAVPPLIALVLVRELGLE